ncbi:MAG: VOC family protein [Burkholderiaceae bacterium]
MSHIPGKFVWFEHRSPDIPKARKFYDALFGWHTEAMPIGGQRYSMILNGDGTTSTGIGGYGANAAGTRPHWMSYLSVGDVDASYQAALAAGATSVSAPTDYGPVGRGAALRDPTGAVFSLWRSAEGDRADAEKTPIGDWCWNELWTNNAAQALGFYERVFGYRRDAMDMGPMGTYYMLKTGEVARAGLMQSVDPNAPSMWLPYVAVADCDATVARARALGGQVLSTPEEIPNIGRFAILQDTLGAAIAVIRLVG